MASRSRASDPNVHFDMTYQRWYRHDPETRTSVWLAPDEQPRSEGQDADHAAVTWRSRSQALSGSTTEDLRSTYPTEDSLIDGFGELSLGQGYTYTQARTQEDSASQNPSAVQYEPKQDITDKKLFQKGFEARSKVTGSLLHGRAERLDPRYRIQTRPETFFVVGRVIKILWPELGGNAFDNVTLITDSKFKEERVISKVRWFVVVRAGKDSCTCLPISTYSLMGVSRRPNEKWHHSVIYTGSEPRLLPGEAPERNQLGMLKSIAVRPSAKGGTMMQQSRLNYNKLYTVEHNVKVFDFGMVKREHIPILKQQWKRVWDAGMEDDDSGDETEMLTAAATSPAVEREYAAGRGAYSDQSSAPPKLGTVLHAFVPTAPGQIAANQSDRVYIYDNPYEGWVTVYNMRSAEYGIVPRTYIMEDEEQG